MLGSARVRRCGFGSLDGRRARRQVRWCLSVYDGGKTQVCGPRRYRLHPRNGGAHSYRKLKPIEVTKPPFDAIPAESKASESPYGFSLRVVVEVDFRGWTHGDRVRQASFQGIREDKTAEDVVCEKAIAACKPDDGGAAQCARQKQRQHCRRASHASRPDLLRMSASPTHDLADFYVQIWKWMRPHLVGRLIALLRCPEGASRQCFFKNMRVPESRSSIFILFRKKATRLFPSTT